MIKINNIYKERFIYKNVKLRRFENYNKRFSKFCSYTLDNIVFQRYECFYLNVNINDLTFDLYNRNGDLFYYQYNSKRKQNSFKYMVNELLKTNK